MTDSIGALLGSGFSIVRHPDASVIREKKARSDQPGDRLLALAGYDRHGKPRVVKPSRRMYGKLQQVWPIVLEARSRGESVARIARTLKIKPHTIAHHLAARRSSVA